MTENFNYIAFGSREYIEESGGLVEMNRSRMFEYTPVEVEKRLERLDKSTIEFIESIPTFLCSEIEQGRNSAVMLVKYGRIENTEVGKREVRTRFKTEIDFGEVQFGSTEEARDVLGADGLQLYRTHWAVKEGSAQDILDRFMKRKPEVFQKARRILDVKKSKIDLDPPKRRKNIIGTANSVEGFLRILYKSERLNKVETFFRGHGSSEYELTPSLMRKWPNGDWKYTESEDLLCKELLIAHYDEFQGDQYCFDRLVRMQHYGLPTRLLDISGNPLMALFFACSGSLDMLQVEGGVIVFRIESRKVKYYDSDTVSCLSNLCNLSHAQKNQIKLNVSLKDFNQTDIAQKLIHYIRSEKAYFEPRIDPDQLGSIVCVKAKQTNTRIKSQSGAFLLFGHEANLPEMGQEGIEIERIIIKNKAKILDQLSSININATIVYPSIDRTTLHLCDR